MSPAAASSVTRRGSSEHALTVGTSDLISVATRDNAMVLAIRSYSGGARSDLYTVRSGSVYGPEPLDEEPSALAVSAAVGTVPWQDALPYLFGSAVGGWAAGMWGRKIPVKWLHRGLGILILWGGYRYLC